MKKTPTAEKLEATPNQTTWLIKFPSTKKVQGKKYVASTYPNSDTVYLQTATRGRALAAGAARNLIATARAAIKTAQGKEAQ